MKPTATPFLFCSGLEQVCVCAILIAELDFSALLSMFIESYLGTNELAGNGWVADSGMIAGILSSELIARDLPY